MPSQTAAQSVTGLADRGESNMSELETLCEVCKINPVKEIKLGTDKTFYSKTCAECDKKAEDQKNKANCEKWMTQRAVIAKNKIFKLIPPRFLEAKIDDIESCIRKLIETLPFEKGLFLWGLPGRGKSHILYALAKKQLESDIDVVYWSWEKLLIELRDAPKNKSRKQIIEELTKSDLLILDDIGGPEKTTTYEMTTLFVIFDGRIVNNRPTYFASNRRPEEFAGLYDGRIYSRILGHCELINITGQDRRLKMNQTSLFGEMNNG
jgi:DNA replication protein DnaC